MKFEVLNQFGEIKMNTKYVECIPNKEQINELLKTGHKFKLNGKYINKKELNEFLTNIGRNK